VSTDPLAALTREVRPLVAHGSDAATVAALLAWSVRPRRTLEGLRRTLAVCFVIYGIALGSASVPQRA